MVLVLGLAWTIQGLADEPDRNDHKAAPRAAPLGGGSPAAAAGAQAIPPTLDQALVEAMERNPAIVTAKAKVALAEAELNSTRMEVAKSVIDLWGERQTQSEMLNLARRKLGRVASLRKKEAVGGEEENFENARRALIDAEAKRARRNRIALLDPTNGVCRP